MTIICIKDGVVAADGSRWEGRVRVVDDKRKIARSVDGAIGGAAGYSGDTTIFRRWFAVSEFPEQRNHNPKNGPIVFDKESGFSALWLERDGTVWAMAFDGKPYELGSGPQAVGAAWEMALGAMYAGASAEQAVRICVERHDCAGGEIFVERLEPVVEEFVEIQEARTYRSDLFDDNGKPIIGAAQEYAKWRAETFIEVVVEEMPAVPSQMDEWRERMGLA